MSDKPAVAKKKEDVIDLSSIKPWVYLASVVMVLYGAFSKVVMPVIREDTAQQIKQAKEQFAEMIAEFSRVHNAAPHDGAATDSDVKLLIERIAPLATKADITEIRSDVRHLSEDVRGLKSDVRELRGKKGG